MLYKLPTDLELQQRVVGVQRRFSPEMRQSYLHFLLYYKPEVQYIDPLSVGIWLGNISNMYTLLNDEGSSFAVLAKAIMQVELLFTTATYPWKVKAIDSVFDYAPQKGGYVDL